MTGKTIALFIITVLILTGLAISFISPLRAAMLGLASQLIAENSVKIEHNISYGPNKRHTLNRYTERMDNNYDKKPILIFYYGGGWTSGDKSLYHFLGAKLASLGMEVIIPDYRLFPEIKFPTFINDAALAYQWVEKNITKASDRPIILMGHSAGAHIAAHLAFNQTWLSNISQNKPKAFIGLAGPYAFDPTTWPTTKDIFSDVKLADNARPISFVSPQSPPTLLFHGEKDDVVKLWNQEQLTEKLKTSKVSVDANLVPNVGHIDLMLSVGLPFKNRSLILNKIETFIEKQFNQ